MIFSYTTLRGYIAPLLLVIPALVCLAAFDVRQAEAQSGAPQKPHEDTILAPAPSLPIPPQGEVPTGAPKELPSPKAGKGAYFIAHRYYGEKETGWGWIKPASGGWSDAKWCALKETPGVIMAPFRTLPNRWDDHNHEYKVWGRWADYTAYDPHSDEDLPVFILEGYESLGPQKDLKKTPGAVRRARPSRGSTSR